MSFQGVFVATVTPFLGASQEVDFQAFTQHLNWLSESGVHGFVPCGTTGEGPCLTSVEWKRLIEITCEKAQTKKQKVIAGCGSNHTAAALEKILEAAKIGAHAALVVTPYYNKPTQEGLLAHYQFLADKSPIPIFLYHVPGRTQVTFQLPTLQKLFEHPNIVGIKEASGTYAFWMGMTQLFDWKAKTVLAGDDDAFALLQQLGARGIISASANVAPKPFVELFELTQKGLWAEAFQLQKRLIPLIQAMFMETNPAPVKEALSQMGKMKKDLRLPLVPVLPKTQMTITQSLQTLGLL